jgi:hypothetical protein
MPADVRQSLSPHSWPLEFRTIRVMAARGSGHTTAISMFLKQATRNNQQWIVSAWYNHQLEIIGAKHPHLASPIGMLPVVARTFDFRKCKGIIVDEVRGMNAQELASLYRCLAKHIRVGDDFTVILVG